MGRYYQGLDRAGGFDYNLQAIEGLEPQLYRGPAVDFSQPYLAFIGAAQTFGRFVEQPFATLLGQRLGIQVVNLGIGGAGPRHFNTEKYLSILNQAEAVVLQVLSGRSSSNSMFDNAASGGLRGKSAFDNKPIIAGNFFARLVQDEPLETVMRIVAETRDDYTKQYIDFIKKISAPRILFWLSTRQPDYQEVYGNAVHAILGAFPHLINQGMIAKISALCDDYVQCVSSAGLPQKLWPAEAAIDGTTVKDGVLLNRYYPSPQMHEAAADALEKSCRRFLGRLAPTASTPAGPRFVILTTERTGSNLLVSLLNNYEHCFCGGELFNNDNIAADRIPWLEIPDAERAGLLALRKTDTTEFWHQLCAIGLSKGHRAIGFKLMYAHTRRQQTLLETIRADRSIRIIHLTRRNLLRRLVSEQQARATNQWALIGNAARAPRPRVEISGEAMLKSFQLVEANQMIFNSMFESHPMLRLFYEDLAARPHEVTARAAGFLGLPQRAPDCAITHHKTGEKDLAQGLAGFDELHGRMLRWTSFFET